MLYAYAIGMSPEPPDVAGLRGAPLRTVGGPGGGPYAIVSEHGELPLGGEPEDLWVHEDVLEEAMKEGPVLPMRLGSTFAGDGEFLQAMRERDGEFRRALRRVEGAVELGVRALLAPMEAAGEPQRHQTGSGGSGTAYMLSRLEETKAGRHLALAIHQPLAELARASTWQFGGPDRRELISAYLVDHGAVDAFRARVEELERGADTAIVCTGPWPPYSFVTEDGS